ncbi:hypothetical protein MNBD_NITROSPINAE02-449 [hydrothermal vent metagenome]|uniref:Uncharacterized protein n=1 Tax=hydrothermal vent metagenome TaxID=652676 RepID=A0A3B1BID4_9ZZZZ
MNKIIVIFLVFAVSFTAGASIAQSRKLAAEMLQQSLLEAKTMQETRPTMEPGIFSRSYKAQATYQIAKEIPGVLDKIFCYCYCSINPRFKHKSLLTCYVDDHASMCGICMKETIMAKQMTDQGMTPQQIAMAIKKKYVRSAAR